MEKKLALKMCFNTRTQWRNLKNMVVRQLVP